MYVPTAHVTIYRVGDDTAHFALDGDELFVAVGEPPDWADAAFCGYGQGEFPRTTQAIEALLLAVRAERTVLGDTGYTCDQLGFSLNEHTVLEFWVRATRPLPGEYTFGSEYNPGGLTLTAFGSSRETRVVVHHDFYITRGS